MSASDRHPTSAATGHETARVKGRCMETTAPSRGTRRVGVDTARDVVVVHRAASLGKRWEVVYARSYQHRGTQQPARALALNKKQQAPQPTRIEVAFAQEEGF